MVAEWHVAHATAAKAPATLRMEGLATTVTDGAGGTVIDTQAARSAPRAGPGKALTG